MSTSITTFEITSPHVCSYNHYWGKQSSCVLVLPKSLSKWQILMWALIITFEMINPHVYSHNHFRDNQSSSTRIVTFQFQSLSVTKLQTLLVFLFTSKLLLTNTFIAIYMYFFHILLILLLLTGSYCKYSVVGLRDIYIYIYTHTHIHIYIYISRSPTTELRACK